MQCSDYYCVLIKQSVSTSLYRLRKPRNSLILPEASSKAPTNSYERKAARSSHIPNSTSQALKYRKHSDASWLQNTQAYALQKHLPFPYQPSRTSVIWEKKSLFSILGQSLSTNWFGWLGNALGYTFLSSWRVYHTKALDIATSDLFLSCHVLTIQTESGCSPKASPLCHPLT
jgi:hypothetical protein